MNAAVGFDETSYLPPAQVGEMAEALAPGQSFVFAKGEPLGEWNPTVQLVRGLVAGGGFTLHKGGRDEAGRLRQVLRRVPVQAAPAAPARSALAVHAARLREATEEAAIYAVLAELAGAGRAMPSNAALAREAGLRRHSADAARYRLRRLEDMGWIAITRIDDPQTADGQRRVCTIRATGERTA